MPTQVIHTIKTADIMKAIKHKGNTMMTNNTMIKVLLASKVTIKAVNAEEDMSLRKTLKPSVILL